MNSAGITVRKPVLELSLAEWDEVIRTNLTGCFLTARAFGPTLISQGWGRVINLSSVRLAVTSAGLAAYAASKGAIAPLTKTLALEWVEYGVTANAIAPGYVDTPLVEYVKDLPQVYADTLRPIPMGRWGEPREIARVAVFLASDAGRFVTGHTLVVDGETVTFGDEAAAQHRGLGQALVEAAARRAAARERAKARRACRCG